MKDAEYSTLADLLNERIKVAYEDDQNFYVRLNPTSDYDNIIWRVDKSDNKCYPMLISKFLSVIDGTEKISTGELRRRNFLKHHGIKGQEWGVRHGPPYPLRGGSYKQGKKRPIKTPRFMKNTDYDKKHFDKTIAKGTELQTLTRDPKRLHGTDMYYATFDKFDNAQFRAKFNSPVKEPIVDKNGKVIGHNKVYKMNAATVAKHDIKVASEDSQNVAFKKLFTKDRDFYNFCTNENRLLSYVESTPWGWITEYDARGNLGSRAIRSASKRQHTFTEKELNSICRIFTTGLPNDGTVWGQNNKPTSRVNKSVAKDYATQRAKFFKELSKNGYGALLDVTDAVDMHFKSNAPVVVFDMDAVIPKEVTQLTIADVKKAKREFSTLKRFMDKFS